MKVKDLMSTDIACIKTNTPLHQAASYMRKNNIGSLPVCDDSGHVKGILTDRDIVIRALAKCRGSHEGGGRGAEHLMSMTAGDIMTSDPVTASSQDNIHDAALLFSFYKVRRLPVTENSRLVGMLSLGDLAVKPVCIDEAGDALSAISLADGLQAGS